MKQHKINCLKCIHYYVTWDSNFPNGCRIMKFKTKEMPSITVLKNTGHECLLFALKTQSHNTNGKDGKFSEKA